MMRLRTDPAPNARKTGHFRQNSYFTQAECITEMVFIEKCKFILKISLIRAQKRSFCAYTRSGKEHVKAPTHPQAGRFRILYNFRWPPPWRLQIPRNHEIRSFLKIWKFKKILKIIKTRKTTQISWFLEAGGGHRKPRNPKFFEDLEIFKKY